MSGKQLRHALLRELVRRVARPGLRRGGRRLPARLELPKATFRNLDRRKPGSSRHVTQRRESDADRDPFGRLRGLHHRHGDRLSRAQRGPASKDYAAIAEKFRPATPTTPTTRNTACAIRAAAAARRRARPWCAWRGRDREEVPAGAYGVVVRGTCATRPHRLPLRLGGGGTRILLRARRQGRRRSSRIAHGRAARERRLVRRAGERGGERRAGRLGRAGVRAARRRHRRGDDGHQRGEGRGDRSGLRRGRRKRAASTATR